jgi:hypothetical protein
MTGCQHPEFAAHASVYRINDGDDTEPHSFACDLRVKCAVCGAPFGFRAPDVGLLPDRPADPLYAPLSL